VFKISIDLSFLKVALPYRTKKRGKKTYQYNKSVPRNLSFQSFFASSGFYPHVDAEGRVCKPSGKLINGRLRGFQGKMNILSAVSNEAGEGIAVKFY
jgi:hypothetical protein